MVKKYLPLTVFQAVQQRLQYLFAEFENIYVSFSGGKDSSLLLNLLLDYREMHCPNRVIGVFHQDFEAQYTVTTNYITQTFKRLENKAELYWVCLPMATRTALSNYEMYWYPWDDKKQELWVRPMPNLPYIINLNNPFTHYRYKMHQEDLAKQFSRFYKEQHQNDKTVCLLGIRANESLQRYSGFLNKKYGYKNKCWITKQFKDIYCASPLYDWTVQDVWAANAKFGFSYNPLYDLYYKAGLKPEQMRVASPFNDYSKESLNLYRVIDPAIWAKLVGRVQGANFGAIYGKTKAMGYRSITLPPGHTWRSYTKFLLDTLPPRLQKNYIKKFNTSIKFWHETGGGLSEETIAELQQKGYRIRRNGISNYTLDKKSRIVFEQDIPDETDNILTSKDIPSWKRMCYCILKNDHTCRFMGFGLTRQEQQRVNLLKEKYLGVLHE